MWTNRWGTYKADSNHQLWWQQPNTQKSPNYCHNKYKSSSFSELFLNFFWTVQKIYVLCAQEPKPISLSVGLFSMSCWLLLLFAPAAYFCNSSTNLRIVSNTGFILIKFRYVPAFPMCLRIVTPIIYLWRDVLMNLDSGLPMSPCVKVENI